MQHAMSVDAYHELFELYIPQIQDSIRYHPNMPSNPSANTNPSSQDLSSIGTGDFDFHVSPPEDTASSQQHSRFAGTFQELYGNTSANDTLQRSRSSSPAREQAMRDARKHNNLVPLEERAEYKLPRDVRDTETFEDLAEAISNSPRPVKYERVTSKTSKIPTSASDTPSASETGKKLVFKSKSSTGPQK